MLHEVMEATQSCYQSSQAPSGEANYGSNYQTNMNIPQANTPTGITDYTRNKLVCKDGPSLVMASASVRQGDRLPSVQDSFGARNTVPNPDVPQTSTSAFVEVQQKRSWPGEPQQADMSQSYATPKQPRINPPMADMSWNPPMGHMPPPRDASSLAQPVSQPIAHPIAQSMPQNMVQSSLAQMPRQPQPIHAMPYSPSTPDSGDGRVEMVELDRKNMGRRATKKDMDPFKKLLEGYGMKSDLSDSKNPSYHNGILAAFKFIGIDPIDNETTRARLAQLLPTGEHTDAQPKKSTEAANQTQPIDVEQTASSSKEFRQHLPSVFQDEGRNVTVIPTFEFHMKLRQSKEKSRRRNFIVVADDAKIKLQDRATCLIRDLGADDSHVVALMKNALHNINQGTHDIENDACMTFSGDVVQEKVWPSLTILQPAAIRCKRLTALNPSVCLDCNKEKIHERAPCRFSEFRKFVVNAKDFSVRVEFAQAVVIYGSMCEASEGTLRTVLPNALDAYPTMKLPQATRIINVTRKLLGNFLTEEEQILDKFAETTGNKLPYYRKADGIRELCDVCLTTIFNLHLLCPVCAFAVCRKCVHIRVTQPEYRAKEAAGAIRDKYGWKKCTSVDISTHKPGNMKLAQLIPDLHPQVLSTMREMVKLSNPSLMPIENEEIEGVIEESAPLLWQCNDDLLLLTDPSSAHNLATFQKHWSKSLPVVIETKTRLDAKMWDLRNIWSSLSGVDDGRQCKLVDCRTHLLVSKFTHISYFQFIEGYYDLNKRLFKEGASYDLKLKDFPPDRQFKEALVKHWIEFCKVLPLHEFSLPYFSENGGGALNLVNYLPDIYCRPDLGPKMYVAYGMLGAKACATTNLHCDISDAVNILVNVTVPTGQEDDVTRNDLETHLKNEGFEGVELERIMDNWKCAGAIWTIFRPEDSSLIRQACGDMLNFTNKQLNEHYPELLHYPTKPMSKMDDAIHDQSLYLPHRVRAKLRERYGIKGCTFVQMTGDAVFIPAGAPHQVQNLLSCVKVAEDFVSPEGVAQSQVVTNQFTTLSRKHLNKEDKLQLCNIAYHAHRQALSNIKASQSNNHNHAPQN